VAFTTQPHLAPRLKKEYCYTSTSSIVLRGVFYGELYLYVYLTGYKHITFWLPPAKPLPSYKIIILSKSNYVLGAPRNTDERNKRHDHSHGPEGEELTFAIPTWVVDHGWQPEHLFASRQSDEERHNISGQTAVRVAVMFEMHYHQKLRKEDHVHQVRAHRPANREMCEAL